MGDHGIDEAGDEGTVDQIGAELCAFRHCTRHNRCCCSSEYKLKEPSRIKTHAIIYAQSILALSLVAVSEFTHEKKYLNPMNLFADE